jgi:hypothetical protein
LSIKWFLAHPIVTAFEVTRGAAVVILIGGEVNQI